MAVLAAPVSFTKVQNALGVSSSVNTLLALCTHANTNWYAKYKPVRNTAVFYTDQWDATNNCWKSTASWWKGSALIKVGGLTPKSVSGTSNLATLAGYYDGNKNGWTYPRPDGSTYPYRLSDFAQYKHDVDPTFVKWAVPAYIKSGGKFEASCLLCDDDYAVKFSDYVNGLGEQAYFGVMLVNSSNQVKFYATNTNRGIASLLVMAGSTLTEGTWKVYPIMCFSKLTNGTTSSATIYTIPNLNYKTITVGSSRPDIAFRAIYTSSAKTAATLTITNNDTIAYSVGIHVRFTDAAGYNVPEMRSGEINKGSVSVASGASTDVSITGLNASTRYAIWVSYTRVSTQYEQQIFIMSEEP